MAEEGAEAEVEAVSARLTTEMVTVEALEVVTLVATVDEVAVVAMKVVPIVLNSVR